VTVFNRSHENFLPFLRFPAPIQLYATGLGLAAIALAGGLILQGQTVGGPAWAVVLLAGLAVLAERQPVRVTASLEMTVSVLPVLFAAVVYGPLAAMAVGACGLIADLRAPYSRWIIWTSLRALAGGFAGVAASMVLSGGHSLRNVFLAVAVAAFTESVVDVGLGAVVVALRKSASPIDHIRSMRPILLATVPLNTSVIGLLGYAYIEVSAWSVLLFVGPAFAAQSVYRMYREERDAHGRATAAYERLERANLSFATALVATLDARDRYTAGHSAAVAIYSRDIAARMGLTEEQQTLVHVAGLVHDIGKVGLMPGLLEKAGPLTLEERRQMEAHSEIGERILANVEDYTEIAAIVRHHHERIDGRGYPGGLAGEEIPLLSRIIAVADSYNAMTSDRPYRDAMPSRVARLRLAQAVETQFDTSVVAAFEAILAGASEAYRLASSAEFDFGVQDRDAESAPALATAAA
jgi:uncharacterized membrane protein/HD superfamily phosphohydrolase YqeK